MTHSQMPVTDLFKGVAHFFGVRTAEEPAYQIREAHSDKEVRSYNEISIAQIKMNGNFETATENAFQHLSDYFLGRNVRQIKIPMTTPVLLQRTTSGWMMAFVIPSKYTAETAPAPLNPNIDLGRRFPELVAAIRFSGWTNKKIIYAKTKELLKWINQNNKYKVISKPRAAQYDPPYVLPFLRQNEIQVTVVPIKEIH